ncbi:Protein of unknown function [Nocardioides scoriae]|uniref:RDD family protein n=1 Tax=Nocardioides scoriae TaxID=642780 RepID=A0A1H1LCF1_9ACTN|nr:RDD family protein [Nocardioides scoriae]SDR72183.1 Protein of unknown function [Nocardioides scoriae]
MSETAPGWYPDPDPRSGGTSTLRWWDGRQWTGHLAPGGGAAYGSAGPDGVKRTPDGEELAGWGRRLAALVLDGLVTGLVGYALAFPFVRQVLAYYAETFRASFEAAESGAPVRQPNGFEMYADLAGPLAGIALVTLAVAIVYHASFLRWRGATPGKLLLGMRVRLREAPGRLGWSTIAKRLGVQLGPQALTAVPFLGSVAGLLPLLDGLWPLWDPRGQALHDKAAGTNVVRVR